MQDKTYQNPIPSSFPLEHPRHTRIWHRQSHTAERAQKEGKREENDRETAQAVGEKVTHPQLLGCILGEALQLQLHIWCPLLLCMAEEVNFIEDQIAWAFNSVTKEQKV